MMHRERGEERMKDIIQQLDNVSKVETPPRFAGRRQTMVLVPDKTKIKSFKAAESAKEQKQSTEDTEA